jgi:DNA-binding NtrC family response regulator
MSSKNYLSGKRVLIVDDEPDILEVLEELLSECEIEKASTFSDAWELLGTKFYDLAILDIMGVDGYRLLSLANERKITAVMLTAHALSVEDAKKSFKEGAAYYIPKEEMANMETYLTDVLKAKEKNKNSWGSWLNRFDPFFDKKFGPDWQKVDREFWCNF